MTGRILVIALVLSAAVAAVALYYLQVYGFYYEVEAAPGQDVRLVPQGGSEGQPIAYSGFRAIDADSSPIRYRACFETDLSLDELSAAFTPAGKSEPRTAPGWFDCFDAKEIGEALKEGRARAFIGQKNIHFGVDRIIAVTDTGKGFAWHELNNCGQKAYDGTVIGEECPPRPTDR